ncbi:Cof-type HAD-IIB family hydrolase [Geminocystis sp. NIES-3709]|uniref:Cof-type HAD-IIB family hydrolase n=1 Tax=Geminocystis sp. NIES-3709 TaxID=1617448 RepID=UPI000825FA9C|nr:HAD family hydrolase [Geminocystis sp. NIES-3709]
MNNIKVLILDIDGTISGKSNQVNDRVKKAIQKVKNRGIKVGLATGRMYCSALRFYREIGANLPIIAYNGAWIQNPENSEILLHTPVNKEISQKLFSYFKTKQKDHDIEIHLYFNDNLYVEKITKNTDYYVERSGIPANLVDDLASLLGEKPTKILASSLDSNLISEMLTELKNIYHEEEVYLTQSNPIYLEATQTGINKGSAVQYLTEKILKLSADEVMAIGDNFNDYTMLQYVGFSVAMGDAPPEVKKIASTVTLDVENDGVADILDRLF